MLNYLKRQDTKNHTVSHIEMSSDLIAAPETNKKGRRQSGFRVAITQNMLYADFLISRYLQDGFDH